MCQDETNDLTKEQRVQRFAKWRCATVAAIVVNSILLVFMIIVLAMQTLMYAETDAAFASTTPPRRQVEDGSGSGAEAPPTPQPPGPNNVNQVQVHRTVSFGYFRGEICVVGKKCGEAPLEDLTCHHMPALNASKVFSVMSLIMTAAALAVNIFELCNAREPMPHMTIMLLSIVSVFMIVASTCLVVIRETARYDPVDCPGTIPGLVKYGAGDAWRTLSFSAIMAVTMLIVYALRRYANMACCCPPPNPNDLQQVPREEGQPGGYTGAGDEEMRDQPPPPPPPEYSAAAYGSGAQTSRYGYVAQPVPAGQHYNGNGNGHHPPSPQTQPPSATGSPIRSAGTSSEQRPSAPQAQQKDVWENQPPSSTV